MHFLPPALFLCLHLFTFGVCILDRRCEHDITLGILYQLFRLANLSFLSFLTLGVIDLLFIGYLVQIQLIAVVV